jgi:hypothetical protein
MLPFRPVILISDVGAGFPCFQDDPCMYMDAINSYYHLQIVSVPTTLGYVIPFVAKIFRNNPDRTVDDSTIPRTLTLSISYGEPPHSAIVVRTLADIRRAGTFKVLKK